MAVTDRHLVTAIVVTHDGETWLPAVVAALASQTRPADQIMAVDTASNDSSTKLIKAARIPLIAADRDCGFGDAVALAVAKMPKHIEGNSEWIWLIHDDCAPAPTALEKLLEAIDDRPQVAMVGPKLLGWHDRTHILEAGISIAGNGARWTGLEANEYDQGQHDGIHDVLSVSTAGALIRRDIFEELGGFDSNLSLFRDDIDFGWRARVAGHAVIATTSAVAHHAQASASERRSVDVNGAFLHRPLLLDRRNAAYVLLANSSWWMIPWLSIQLLASAMARSIGYLLAKLPGYAADELLAVATLIVKPAEIVKARKFRKTKRLVSARVISSYIPPRWSQIRLSAARVAETIRERVIPAAESTPGSAPNSLEDEDLLVPNQRFHISKLMKNPAIFGYLLLAIITLAQSRNRLGALNGGALAASPSGARDLWGLYFESWHQVGMGSSHASPAWIAVVALASTLLLGKTPLLITLFFLVAPLLMMWSAHTFLRKLSSNQFITIPASFLYALSPVALASLNSGRLATLIALIIAPQIPMVLSSWKQVELNSWRRIYGLSILLAVLTSFTLITTVVSLGVIGFAIVSDYDEKLEKPQFLARLYKRLTLLIFPFLLVAPYSFEALVRPARALAEPGLNLAGGPSALVLLGNPGGAGSLPWWSISPILLLLIIALFSSSHARIFAQVGISFLCVAVIFSSISITVHGNSSGTSTWVGTLLVGATLASVAAGVVILDRLRTVLISSNIHYRHILAGLLLIITAIYSISSIGWSITAGADSPVQSNTKQVMPAFLTAEADTKTLVLREVGSEDSKSIQYYISRGEDISLGEPDVAPGQVREIEIAAQELIDGSGIGSSQVFSAYGIKYVFVKNPFNRNVIRTIDGLGGFARTSATSAGVVWRVTGVTGRIIFTTKDGTRSVLEAGEVGARTTVSGPGSITLTETFDRSWQILQNGYRLDRAKDEHSLPQFQVKEAGEISLLHDGTIRRAWLSLQLIAWTLAIILAAPAGRRKREISEKELA